MKSVKLFFLQAEVMHPTYSNGWKTLIFPEITSVNVQTQINLIFNAKF